MCFTTFLDSDFLQSFLRVVDTLFAGAARTREVLECVRPQFWGLIQPE